MTEESKVELFETVLSHINTYGEESATRAIWNAHMGNPDGWLVKNDNLHLFRQYRNSIDPNPAHLVQSALFYHQAEWEKA